jgi:hypothetical protein
LSFILLDINRSLVRIKVPGEGGPQAANSGAAVWVVWK